MTRNRVKYIKLWKLNGGAAYLRKWANSYNRKLKFLVFSKYGKDGKPLCRWRGCKISDIDMLTLDHILNDGARHRSRGFKSGVNGYHQIKNLNFPKGFQVLCWNHQWKKQIQKLKRK
ncbi:Uncharacterised protein [uncultured archaeon]|nr:Uncharacterised protein [uncultured archaeon]